jgi:hypothetical protein
MAVLDVTTQKVTVVDPAGSCTFTFRSDGVLFYVKSGGITATLWREGSLHPVMRLPDASYHVLAEPEASGTPGAEPRLVVVSVSQTLDAVNVRPEKKHGVLLWATDADEKVPRLLVRSAPREHAFLENAPSPTLAVSPGNRRACLARLPSGIFCLDLRTNTAVVIAPDVVVSGLAYVHGDAAFSPSGTRLAFNGSRVGLPGESVFVHDFASSATREVDAGFYDSRKREYAAIQYVWQDDEHLIESAIRPDQIVSFDVATGARRVLWHRASGAPHVYFLHPTPGHPSIVYANRDKADLVRIATP